MSGTHEPRGQAQTTRQPPPPLPSQAQAHADERAAQAQAAHMPEDAHAAQRPPGPNGDPNQQPRAGEPPAGDPPVIDQQVYGPYSATTFFSPAFPGMKATAEEDIVESWPAGAVCPFGAVVTKGVSANGTGALVVSPGGAGAVAGVAVHEHTVAVFGAYQISMAVSVMTRGRIWCQVDGSGAGIGEGVAVNFNPANGFVTAATGTAVLHAAFRGVMQGFYDYTTGITTNIAEVELHYPGIA